jgi:REP element-mobilizing transposase RayT
MQNEYVYQNVSLVRRISRQIVFKSVTDYRDFINILSEGRDRQPVNVGAFCLLPNSVNILLDYSDEVNASRFLQWIFATHAKRYQAKHDAEGSLWRGRVQRIPVQTNETRRKVVCALLQLPYRYRLIAPQECWPWSRVGDDLRKNTTSPQLDKWQYRYVEHCNEVGTPVGDLNWLTGFASPPNADQKPKRRGRPPKERWEHTNKSAQDVQLKQ